MIALQGVGLHGGAPSRVVLARRAGPVALRQRGVEVPLRSLRVAGTVRATSVEGAGAPGAGGTIRVSTVDHLFAALGGLRIHEGVIVDVVEGDELPILDGCATAWCEALARLEVAPAAPRLRVARAGVVEVRASRYAFAPHEGTRVEVEIDFGDARLAPYARWDGDPRDFTARVAPARTFAFARELEAFAARGLARHVAPESVVVLTDEAVLCAGRPFESDELARHKLLDLVGDLYLHGGPPIGIVRASRPGHGATHDAVLRALAAGVLAL